MKRFLVGLVALFLFGITTLSLCMTDGYATFATQDTSFTPVVPLSKTSLTANTQVDVSAWMAN